MNINETLQNLKKRPGFADNVGMMLIHNGTVRSWSRDGHKKVSYVQVRPDYKKVEDICREFELREGIFAILAEAKEGKLFPGDDLLFLVVAGDIRENVKSALSELLDRIKKEAIFKQEIIE